MLLGFSTFAFAGVYLPTLAVPALIAALLLVGYRPWPRTTASGRWSAGQWAAAALGLTLLQLVPLPGPLIDLVSPHARATWQQLVLEVPRSLPLSIDLAAGAWAWLVAFCTTAVFLAARHIFAGGGVRRVTRAIASIGLVVSVVALAQEASGHGLMYWTWRPLQEGAAPFGPFVNRNHFGTWAILALPLVGGYLAAHAAAHHPTPAAPKSWRARLRLAGDGRAIWLTAAMIAMIVALVTSLSRSAFFGLAVAALAAARCRTRHASLRVRPALWLTAGLLLAALAVTFRVDPVAIGARLAATPVSAYGRLTIWRDTLPVIRDFWLTGTGAGTYETVMLVYQRSMPGVRFNQAHNQYLQLAAEGGLLLCVPLALWLRAFLRDVREALAHDDSGIYFVRAGAVCGLAGAAAQSFWETGLTTPANAFLAAVLAAIAVHTPVRSGRATAS